MDLRIGQEAFQRRLVGVMIRRAEASMDENGLVTVESNHPVAAVLSRLETTLAAKGIALFARIDHAAGAAGVGLALRPTTVMIFGDPRAGTPLMQSDQRIGLDLPLKVLAWEATTVAPKSPTVTRAG
jgi:uncharacterized protein (DUF302 family)